ncbi:Glucokinase 1 [Tritrichomonas foetus]|uniref:Glucokinase 1 n=1 Tax=Tritrichomonas foetus TaxID=1144522 RepID=A0A1J4JZU8_9EUKA|nr:Glucokinase 1 [Tritrichomonas foetus]|eukprot:OHT04689.1 Glucokinase 1 [Tritrichomonas foetus]
MILLNDVLILTVAYMKEKSFIVYHSISIQFYFSMISKELFKPILNWPKDSKLPLCVACDVGGSGTYVRLSSFFDESQYIDLPKLKTQKASDLISALNTVSKELKSVAPTIECRGSSLSVAGPITEDTVVFTNWPGQYSNRTLSLSELPTDLFPKNRSKFLNDTESIAYGILAVNRLGTLDKYFEKLFSETSPDGPPVNDRRTAVVSVGTGLGCSLIVKTPLFNRKIVVPTELGHLELPIVGHRNANYQFERELVQHISNHWYEGELAIEFEDITSGKGLCNVYQFLVKKATGKVIPTETLDGAQIAQMAAEKEPLAYKALVIFNQMVIRAAKTISTTMNCDSVILASDNQADNYHIIKDNYSLMKNEFYSFIRPNWLNTITVFTQTKRMNFNLFGTSHIAHQLSKK